MSSKKFGSTNSEMQKNNTTRNQTQFRIRVQSKIHSEIYHSVQVNLHCYEKMPERKRNLYCYEHMPDERELVGLNQNNRKSKS